MQSDFAKVKAAALFAADNVEMDLRPMEILESGSHVALVDEQGAVGFGNLRACERLDERQRQTGAAVEIVQGIDMGRDGGGGLRWAGVRHIKKLCGCAGQRHGAR